MAISATFPDRYPEAPFPWFGGKRDVAELVWSRFGPCKNYVEPFAGSLAVLLRRPVETLVEGALETVNDLDCYVVNFWRSVRQSPGEVAKWADWPVCEADVLARHRWLLGRDEFRRRIFADPSYCMPKVAGWWVYGQCAWIGCGWCYLDREGPPPSQIPRMTGCGQGINRRVPERGLPHLSTGRGVNRTTPNVPADFAAELAAAYLRPDGEVPSRPRGLPS